YPKKFVIDELRCVVCGFCVEACPKDAIRMDTGIHPPPTYEREGQIYDEKRLLRGPAVSYENDPWLVRPSKLTAAALEANRKAARPFGKQAQDEYAQTPGFSVRELAAEAKARGESAK
ncbi:MAG TPA: 4Fe-4S binding protein, partial [Anaeromyxobacteraceae bacterium]|nr:4Fe-4S binding protein [Anaeromyxobacteraceae bacterium]